MLLKMDRVGEDNGHKSTDFVHIAMMVFLAGEIMVPAMLTKCGTLDFGSIVKRTTLIVMVLSSLSSRAKSMVSLDFLLSLLFIVPNRSSGLQPYPHKTDVCSF